MHAYTCPRPGGGGGGGQQICSQAILEALPVRACANALVCAPFTPTPPPKIGQALNSLQRQVTSNRPAAGVMKDGSPPLFPPQHSFENQTSGPCQVASNRPAAGLVKARCRDCQAFCRPALRPCSRMPLMSSLLSSSSMSGSASHTPTAPPSSSTNICVLCPPTPHLVHHITARSHLQQKADASLGELGCKL